MPDTPPATQWKTLDQDLNRLSRLEDATMYTARPLVGVGISLVFVSLAAVAAALEVGARAEMADKRIVVILPSFAERYLSTDLFAGV